MTRRLWTAAHWTAVTTVILAATQLAPFTGPYATASDLVIAAGVGLIGLAIAPQENTR